MGFPEYTELAKHMRYKRFYKENDLFWGLGIEEETYLQFTRPIYVAAPILRTCHAAERYSVRYYTTYKPTYKLAFQALFTDSSGSSGFYPLPYFFNAHSFTKMDTNGQHATTYEKLPKPNPNFSGKTFFQQLEENTPGCFKKKFIDIFNKNCIFDGDTLEFMTQDFFKAKVSNVVNELIQSKKEVLDSINNFLIKNKLHRDKGLLMYPPVNPGFAIYYSNPKNVTMFNNGTYHINITLPTMLGKNDINGIPKIVDSKGFREKHKIFIRLIQWLEPVIIAVYGTKDPLSDVSPSYSKASQRCAVSRYIGIGTFDTVAMTPGKVLTVPVKDIHGSDTDFWWYKVYHSTSGYNALSEIGVDINYRKHYNHGVEIRFLDAFPNTMLKGLIEFYICLGDMSLESNMPENAIMSPIWNNFVVDVLKGGPDIPMGDSILKIYETLFKVKINGCLTVRAFYNRIFLYLKKKYKNSICNKLFV
jgi:hypothetical protein